MIEQREQEENNNFDKDVVVVVEGDNSNNEEDNKDIGIGSGGPHIDEKANESHIFKEGHCEVSHNRGSVVKLYYQLHGRGNTKVLMIMGFLTSCEAWKHQLEYFNQFPEQYQICIFDNRGIGKSDTPNYNYSSNHMARDGLELMDHLGWQQAHIVGVSMGGMIALELATSAHARVSTLSLCVTHAGGFGRIPPILGMLKMLRSFTIKDHRERGRVLMPILYSENYLKKLDENGQPILESLLDSYVEDVSKMTLPKPAAVAGHIKTVTTHHITDSRLRELKEKTNIPILVMCGDIDHLVRTSNSFLLRDILSPAEFIQFDSGHCINVEHKQEFNEALARNFKRYTPQ
ncbi:hypothetical protein PPL_07943 [Heterostelium album PN500]|uniref:AB hydrolase-1 domain-containing protein n=1 Tax=Heterostelium pallidum (strain ATCC 26659 / Pp 5 / PN500) TaxID=670386 RepID=D3BHE1_HETP5|nr:hypothetical protein PPL_07943 [Heterostelium album PN500]EFA79118.1 hypothetical protein PPL_07943 [Heterostelium album PN500]|eukprot:XP_020431240.1 hypothetical protein PPL_07943 [Heterostelium album PN500]